jgi:hypothetical protein
METHSIECCMQPGCTYRGEGCIQWRVCGCPAALAYDFDNGKRRISLLVSSPACFRGVPEKTVNVEADCGKTVGSGKGGHPVGVNALRCTELRNKGR